MIAEVFGDDLRVPVHADADVSVESVLLLMLDWMAAHKVNHTVSAAIWSKLALVCPPNEHLGVYSKVRKLMELHENSSVFAWDACPAGCMVYKDFGGSLAHHQYADLDACPYPSCGLPRFVRAGGVVKACHTIYHLPIAGYIQDLFARPDLVPYLKNTPGEFDPHGGVKHSRGYRDKVLNNPKMNDDDRHQAVILSADGIPYFGSDGANGTRGAWPIVFRSANLPDGLWTAFEYAHLAALEAQEHWALDDFGRLRVERR